MCGTIMRTKTIVNFLYKPKTLRLIGVLFALAAGILDVLMDNSILPASLYLLPIMWIAWFGEASQSPLLQVYAA